jgi:hypothetical protein
MPKLSEIEYIKLKLTPAPERNLEIWSKIETHLNEKIEDLKQKNLIYGGCALLLFGAVIAQSIR